MIGRFFRRLRKPPPGTPRGASPSAPGAALPPALIGLTPEVIARRYHRWLLGVADLDAELPNVAALEAAEARLRRTVRGFDVAALPRLPTLVPQLLATLRRDDVDAAELAALVARDAVLVGEVLRMANSIWYRGTGTETRSLPQAILAIGLVGLREAVLRSALRPILHGQVADASQPATARLWEHAEAGLTLCGQLAANRCDVASAQLTGIVAAFGASALLRIVPPLLLTPAAADPGFAACFLRFARPLSAAVVAHWQLPPPVQAAMADYAEHGSAATNPVARVVAAADQLAMGAMLVRAGVLGEGELAAVPITPPDTAEARGALIARVAAADGLVPR